MSFNEHVTLRGGEIAGHDVHGGGFAGAVGPQQAVNTAVLHSEADIIDRGVFSVPKVQLFSVY